MGLSCCFCMQLFCLKPWWCAVQLLGESGILLLHLRSFLVAHLNHKIKHWYRLCFHIAHLVETCCLIIVWGNRSKCILVLWKWGSLFPYFFQFLWNLLKLFSPAITTWSVMHRTVRTVPNRSHLSPAWRCSLLWCRYGPHMTAEADHKVQEYCYLPRLSDPELLDFAFKQDFFSTLRRTKNNRGKTGHQIERVSYH